MNSLERLLASAKGCPTDNLPVAPGIGCYAAVQAGIPMTKVCHDAQLMTEAVLNSLFRHQYDSCGPITDYGLGTESMGSQVRIGDWEQTSVVQFAVKSRSDVAKLRTPDPLRDGRMPVIIDCEQMLLDRLEGRYGVNGGVAGPLSFATNLLGLSPMLYSFTQDPRLVHELVSISLETTRSFALAQIRRGGVKTINVYEPVTTLISNSMAEEFSFSYLEDLIKSLKTEGVTVLLHICGDTTRFLERMICAGADILSLDVQVDLAEAKRISAGRAVISGNVATEHLCRASSRDIFEESCACIDKAATGGRFTLSSSCEVPPETPPANIDAMVRAAREYGREVLKSGENAYA